MDNEFDYDEVADAAAMLAQMFKLPVSVVEAQSTLGGYAYLTVGYKYNKEGWGA